MYAGFLLVLQQSVIMSVPEYFTESNSAQLLLILQIQAG
jgi:hypothetical protein